MGKKDVLFHMLYVNVHGIASKLGKIPQTTLCLLLSTIKAVLTGLGCIDSLRLSQMVLYIREELLGLYLCSSLNILT